jgi:hypothetical protein
MSMPFAEQWSSAGPAVAPPGAAQVDADGCVAVGPPLLLLLLHAATTMSAVARPMTREPENKPLSIEVIRFS